MIDLSAVGRLHFGIVDGLHFDLAGPQIDDAAIARHGSLLLETLRPVADAPGSPSYNAFAPASATA